MSVPFLLIAAATAAQVSPEAAEAAETFAGDGGEQVVISMLLLGGLLLVMLETIVPGGLLGTLGGAMILWAVIMTAQIYGGNVALVVLAVTIVLVIVAVIVGFKILPETALGKKLILTPSPGSGSEPVTLEAKARAALKPGDQGVTISDLRPGGWAKFHGNRVNVVTRGEFINEGEPVAVVAMDGTRVVVRADPQAGSAEA